MPSLASLVHWWFFAGSIPYTGRLRLHLLEKILNTFLFEIIEPLRETTQSTFGFGILRLLG